MMPSLQFCSKAAVSSLIIACALAPVAAQAEGKSGGESSPTVSVNISDLNLTSESGQAVLTRRVRQAVATICGVGSSKTVSEQVNERSCRDKALASAQTQMQVAIERARSGQAESAISLHAR